MKSKIILLRKELSPSTLNYHLRRLFRITTFSSDYISIRIQVVDRNNKLNRFYLGENTAINIKEKSDKNRYIEHAITELNKYSSKHEVNAVGKLNIIYMPISKEDYKAFFSQLFKNQIR